MTSLEKNQLAYLPVTELYDLTDQSAKSMGIGRVTRVQF